MKSERNVPRVSRPREASHHSTAERQQYTCTSAVKFFSKQFADPSFMAVCLASFMVITGKIKAGKGSVLFVAHLQAQPLPVSTSVLFCVHIANMGEEVSFFKYDC